MQILQWLFKVAHGEQARETSPSSTNKKTVFTVQEAESNDLALFKKHGVYQRPKRFEKGEVNLKRIGRSFHKRRHWIHAMKMKKEEHDGGLGVNQKADSATHIGNKVIPICDGTISSSTIPNEDQCGSSEKKDKVKGDKNKAISRMKELLRWAAAAKSEKGGQYIRRKVLYFRNRGTIKAVEHDDQLSTDSPKISFRWDVESCSISSPAYSAMSVASSSRDDRIWTKPTSNSTSNDVAASDGETKRTMLVSQDKDEFISRTGNWITTDSEFVVLEL